MSEIITIIVSYNGERWIQQCLDCLSRSTVQTEIVIVDNASTDSTRAIIRKHYPGVVLLENKLNKGFGQANNVGMEYAITQKAEFVFLLNQDAYPYPDTLEKLLSIHARHPEYGIISPVQKEGTGEKLDVLFSSFIANNYPEAVVRKIENAAPDSPEIFPVRFVNATSWFISMKCLQVTGLFSPLFYHYGEDNHYCSRAQYHGFKVGVATTTAVRHDKAYHISPDDLLQRKIKLDPLYILLDIRKGIGLVYLIVCWKLVGYGWKSICRRSPAISGTVVREAVWILTHVSLIRETRMESKIPYMQ